MERGWQQWGARRWREGTMRERVGVKSGCDFIVWREMMTLGVY